VHVASNGIAAACKGNHTCDFVYDVNLTARVINVSIINQANDGSATFTIDGTRFSDVLTENTVTVGEHVCIITSGVALDGSIAANGRTGAFRLTCDLPAGVMAGTHVIEVHVLGEGMALGGQTYVVPLEWVSTSPDSAHVGGGVEVAIQAYGLGGNAHAINVTIGGEVASVTALDGAIVTVLLPAQPAMTAGAAAGLLTVNGEQTSFSFDYTAELSVTAVSPMEAGVADRTILTISGSGFDAVTMANNVVWVGPLRCSVLTVPSSSELSCQLDGGMPAVKPVRVFVEEIGWSAGAVDFQHVFRVDHITPKVGSVAGGTILTVSGAGLTSVVSPPSITLGGVACDVLNHSWAELTCRTRPPTSGSLVQVPLDVMGSLRAHDATCGTANDTSATFPTADGTANMTLAGCQFAYIYSAAPNVTSVEPASAAVAGASITITVTGSGFSAVAGENEVWVGERVEGGAFYARYAELADMATCVIINATEYQIVCELPATHASVRNVYVHVAGKGLAAGAPPTFEFLLTVTSTTPTEGSMAGARVHVRGTGFSTNLTETPMAASLGSIACAKLHVVSASEAHCVTAAVAFSGETQQGVQMTVANATVSTCTNDTACTFTPQAALTASITSVSSAAAQLSAGATVTITGAGFWLGSGLTDSPTSSPTSSPTTLSPTVTTLTPTVTTLTPTVTAAAPTASPTAARRLLQTNAPTASPTTSPTTASVFLPVVSLEGVETTATLVSWTDTQIIATLPPLGAGEYAIQVELHGAGLAHSDAAAVSLPLTLSAMSPVQGSIVGGTSITITGAGFSEDLAKNEVTVCNAPCTVTAASTEELVCTTGAIVNEATSAAYGLGADQVLLSSRPYGSSAGSASAVFDGDYATTYITWAKPTCYVGVDLGEGNKATLSQFRVLPRVTTPGFHIPGNVVEGSLDGETWTIVGQAPSEPPGVPGWMTFQINATQAGAMRYWRVAKHGLVSGDRYTCLYAEVEFTGSLMADYPDIGACPVSVKVSDSTDDESASLSATLVNTTFAYMDALTPTISDISPTMGTTGGGTALTITGVGFPSTIPEDAAVTIDGVSCSVTAASATQVEL
jgi:hypothetical protein